MKFRSAILLFINAPHIRDTAAAFVCVLPKKLEAYPFCITNFAMVILLECLNGDDVDNQGSGYDPEAYS